MIKAIVFDIGDVVKKGTKDAHKKLTEILGVDYSEFEKLFHNHLHELLIGKMSCSEFSRIVENQFGVKGVEKKWEQSLRKELVFDNDVIRIVKGLRKRYVLGAISNIIDITVRVNRGELAESFFNSLFKIAVFSCEVGLRKPDKDIFEFYLDKAGLRAAECIFIDDKIENLKNPRKMGFHVIHFESADQLKKELEKLGIEWKA